MSETGIETGRPAVAALPMYDWPDVREATDRLWQSLGTALQARGFPVPD